MQIKISQNKDGKKGYSIIHNGRKVKLEKENWFPTRKLAEEYLKMPNCRRLKYLIKDEIKATNEYKKYGFNKLSSQEHQHKKFLEKKLKVKGCK